MIGKYQYSENPRYTVPARYVRLCRHWLDMKAASGAGGRAMMGMPATPLMPVAGGYMDQPAFLMDAFRMFDHWLQERHADA